MDVQQLFEGGSLGEAIQAQTQAVKSQPTDQDARYELVVLLCFGGELGFGHVHFFPYVFQRLVHVETRVEFKEHGCMAFGGCCTHLFYPFD